MLSFGRGNVETTVELHSATSSRRRQIHFSLSNTSPGRHSNSWRRPILHQTNRLSHVPKAKSPTKPSGHCGRFAEKDWAIGLRYGAAVQTPGGVYRASSFGHFSRSRKQSNPIYSVQNLSKQNSDAKNFQPRPSSNFFCRKRDFSSFLRIFFLFRSKSWAPFFFRREIFWGQTDLGAKSDPNCANYSNYLNFSNFLTEIQTKRLSKAVAAPIGIQKRSHNCRTTALLGRTLVGRGTTAVQIFCRYKIKIPCCNIPMELRWNQPMGNEDPTLQCTKLCKGLKFFQISADWRRSSASLKTKEDTYLVFNEASIKFTSKIGQNRP